MTRLTVGDVQRIASGHDPDPARSMSLRAEAYTDPLWAEVDLQAIFARTWQWICHVEQLREPGSYVSATVAGMPVAVVRGRDRELRAFYNVCKHRAHALLAGSGKTSALVCPYHAWTYGLDGQLKAARRTDAMETFDTSEICLDQVQVEEFGGMLYVNLDATASSLREQAGDLAEEIAQWAPDVVELTHAKRLTYDVSSNWKNVIDNFLECYHCHVAHKEFVDLVDMDTYEVKTHGIWSSHFAEAGKHANAAYDVSGASVTEHAVWWLWPNTCLLRYPGRGNFMVFQVLPAGPDRTLETWDFFFETTELERAEIESVRYIDDVLQVQDINLVESVQRGMRTPAFDQGRIVYDPAGSGLSEHGVHHFHGLVLDAYRALVPAGRAGDRRRRHDRAGLRFLYKDTMSDNTETAILAGGCFWGVQELLRHRDGVISTRVGYTGGENDNPTYGNHPGHAEAVEIVFDPERISYRDILEFFFQIHDPTTKDRQGYDIGSAYRSEIFFTSDEQRRRAEETIADVDASGLWPGKVVTEISEAAPFWEAEPEHQDYLQRIPNGYTCHFPRPGWKLPHRETAA